MVSFDDLPQKKDRTRAKKPGPLTVVVEPPSFAVPVEASIGSIGSDSMMDVLLE